MAAAIASVARPAWLCAQPSLVPARLPRDALPRDALPRDALPRDALPRDAPARSDRLLSR